MSARRGPRPTADRVRRLLVLLPWLMERGEVTVAEAAQRFGLSEAELVRDVELAAMCGLPPFVDEMVDVFIDEGVIYAGLPRLFTRPLRITAPEGFALLAAARVARQITSGTADGDSADRPGASSTGSAGSTALDRALAKLASVLGDEGLVVDTPAPAHTAVLRDAADRSARVRVRYWSARSDRTTDREITPRLVFVDRGRWYVIADDHASGEQRTFRIDRIESVTDTGVTDSPRSVEAPQTHSWFADVDVPQAVLRVPASGAWVAERYPTTAVEADGEGWRIRLPVASERWLRELVLCLGPEAHVLEPAEWTDLGARAARDLLRRYDANRA